MSKTLITLQRFRRLSVPNTGSSGKILSTSEGDINDEVTIFSSFQDAVMQLYFIYGTNNDYASIEQKRNRDGSESIALKDRSNKIILQYKTIV